MNEENSLKIFEDKNIRVQWNADKEEWYFSVVDIVSALTDNDYQTGRKYWKTLKMRLHQEGSQLVTNCYQLKMQAYDGKMRDTDVMETEQILRLVQSIPSKKAEPFKLWLAKVGKERIDEIYDPEVAINRALETYRKKGYSEDWVNQRLRTIDARKEFTDELKRGGINTSKDFATLTNVLTKVWSGNTVKEYKQLKGLKKENLRDNMTNMELVLNMLAEVTSTEIAKEKNPKGIKETTNTVFEGASVAKIAKEEAEKRTCKPIVSNKNAKEIRRLS